MIVSSSGARRRCGCGRCPRRTEDRKPDTRTMAGSLTRRSPTACRCHPAAVRRGVHRLASGSGVRNMDSKLRSLRPTPGGTMKLCLVLVVVAGLATACSRTEQQQATDTQQPASAPPASTPAASPPATAPPAPAPPERAEAPPTPKPAAPPAPQFRDVTIPAGTKLSVTVLSTLARTRAKSKIPSGDRWPRPWSCRARPCCPRAPSSVDRSQM